MSVLLAIGLWIALDVVLVAFWLAVVIRRERAEIRAMVRMAEDYANRAARASSLSGTR